MDTVLFQFHHEAGEPTLAGLVTRYGLQPGDVDAGYGVVLIDPDAGLWVANVAATAAPRIDAALTEADRRLGAGVFANVRIEPTASDEPDPDPSWDM